MIYFYYYQFYKYWNSLDGGVAMLQEPKKSHEDFQPYIGPDKRMPEVTVLSVITGIILLMIFGAANAYLGLKVGMTVSASIPAAVVSMAILRGLFKRGTILENNIVQTITSTGEAVAAGVVFSLPALYMLGHSPSLMLISLVSLFGGIIGVVGMVIYRKYLIVEQHGILPYPEGTACAEILIAGDKGGVSANTVFKGGIIGFLFRTVQSVFGLFPEAIETAIPGLPFGIIGMNVLPSLGGVGYLIGPKISSVMLGGGLVAWIVIIPLIGFFGGPVSTAIFPSATPIGELGAWGVWTDYIQYIGAGALTVGGLVEFFKALPALRGAFKGAFSSIRSNRKNSDLERTNRDIPFAYLLTIFVGVVILMAILPYIPVGIVGAALIAVFGFLFVAISSRIVGIVGSSANPVSGMTIATIFFSAILMKAIGWTGAEGMVAAVIVGSVVTVAAAVAGDMSQDLKTGYIVGATPISQQITELLGVLIFAGVAGYVVQLLNNAYGIGSSALPAPATSVIATLVRGIFEGNLPWALLITGVGLGIIVELMGIPSLPFAIGLYLPVHLTVPIFLGGMVRGFMEKRKTADIESGTLYASGLVAGDALVGVIAAFLTTAGVAEALKFAEGWLGAAGSVVALVLMAGIIYTLYNSSLKREKP